MFRDYVKKNFEIKDIFFSNNKSKNENLIIFIRSNYIEIINIGVDMNIKGFRILKLNYRIRKITNFTDETKGLLFIDYNQKINIIKFNKKLEFKIVSTKNLLTDLAKKNISYTFLCVSIKYKMCLVASTNGVKIFLGIKKKKKKDLKLLGKGIKTHQKTTICFFVASMEEFFIAIETLNLLPYQKFLTLYKHDNGNIKKKVFSRIDSTSYFIIPFPQTGGKQKEFIVLSKGKISIINYKKKFKWTESFPIRKNNDKYSQPVISSSCFYRGKARIFFLFLNCEGDLYSLSIENSNWNCNKKDKVNLAYIGTISKYIKKIKILSNGVLTVSSYSGKNKFYRFINVKNKPENRYGFYIPEYRQKNLFLIDELDLISEVSIFIQEHKTKKYTKNRTYFCNTKNQTTLRFLRKISDVISIFQKTFEYVPVGLFLIETVNKDIYFFTSFQCTTLSFSMNRKIEYSNQLKIISDSKTISIIKLTCLEGLLQVTNKLIRLIRSKNKNIKIYHWKSKTPILKFIHNFHENSYILLLLSNNRIVLIEFINDDLFIELKSWNLEKFDKSLLIMKCYISSNVNDSKFLIIGTKQDRTIRIFKIFPDLSIKINGIYLLNWSPESFILLKNQKNIYLFISLNNGIIVKTSVCPIKNKIKFIESLNISIYPLYFPDNSNSANLIVFGEKIWKIKKSWMDKFQSKTIFNQCFDSIEYLGNFICTLDNKNLKILFYHTKNQYFLNKIGFICNFKPYQSYWIKKKRKFIVVANKNDFSFLPHHEISGFMSSNKKKFYPTTYKYSREKYNSSISILQFYKNVKLDKQYFLYQNDILYLNTATESYYFDSFIKKKSFTSDKYLFLFCKMSKSCNIRNIEKLSPILENLNQTLSFMTILFRKVYKFCSENGGKYFKIFKLNFLFEQEAGCQNSTFCKSFLCKTFIGTRLIMFSEKNLKIFEISKEKLKTIVSIYIPTVNTPKIQTCGHKLYFFEIFKGIKLLIFQKKKMTRFFLANSTWIRDFLPLNPINIIGVDFLKNFFIFETNQSETNLFFGKKSCKLQITSLSNFDLNKNRLKNIFSCF